MFLVLRLGGTDKNHVRRVFAVSFSGVAVAQVLLVGCGLRAFVEDAEMQPENGGNGFRFVRVNIRNMF